MFGCETPPFLLVGGSSFVRSVKIVGFGNLELRSNEREREKQNGWRIQVLCCGELGFEQCFCVCTVNTDTPTPTQREKERESVFCFLFVLFSQWENREGNGKWITRGGVELGAKVSRIGSWSWKIF